MLRAASFLLVLAVAVPASAQESSASASASADVSATTADVETTKQPGAFVVGAEVGAIFPQPFSALGTHVAVGLELGYKLPFAGQRIEIMFAGGYAPPGNSTTINHAGADYQTRVVSQQLHLSLGPRFRFMESTSPWNITFALGPRLYFLRSTSNGSRDGKQMMEFRATSSPFGFFAALGGEYILGPGALFLDVDFGYASMSNHIIMAGRPPGNSANLGNFTTTLGYRFFL
jgi:hypothetical protein